jgi:16S rRNA (uracil1498-N3)-methyltransferase
MPKIFLSAENLLNDEVTLTGDAAHHLLHVLRTRPGDRVIFCDGCGMDFFCECINVTSKKNALHFLVIKKEPCLTEPPVRVTLYQALPKLDKMEWIIQKCVEMGVHRIVPVQTARCVARWQEQKQNRWQRISESAASQSKRGIIPLVMPPVYFKDALDTPEREPLWLVPYENEETLSLRDALKDRPPTDTGLWIGPEGGFAAEEMEALRNRQGIPVTLGRRVLRTETAGLVALAQLLCLWE